MNKGKIAKVVLAAGILAVGWLLDVNGIRSGIGSQRPSADNRPSAAATAATATEATPAVPLETTPEATPAVAPVAATAPATPKPAAAAAPAAKRPAPAAAVPEIRRDGEYDGKDEVAAYIRKFNGALPRNFITKKQARELGWQGGALEPFAPGKSIGGDHFGNYERRLPEANYRECDIGTRGRPRGTKRLIFTRDGKTIYYTPDHYETFEKVPAP